MDDAIVYVVDDIELNRELIVDLMKTVGLRTISLPLAQEFLDVYQPDVPACLLLDIRMPGMSGLELQRLLNEQDIRIPIIFFTAHSKSHLAVQAMKAGAFDFIEKPINAQQVLDLVFSAITECRRIIDEQNEMHAIKERIESLTAREYEVLVQLSNGESNKVIAYNLDISDRTVEVHRSKVMKKMEAPSFTALLKMAMRVNLIN